MADLALHNGGVSLVDDEDLPLLLRWRWISLGGYAVRQQRTERGGSTLIYLHRQLLVAGPGEVVDHINNDRLDNRRSNLRLCSQRENAANRRSTREQVGAYRGVHFEARSGRFRAQIKIGGRNRYLGTFDSAETAARVYDSAAAAAWGRFARLNFPGETLTQLAFDLDDDPFDVPAPHQLRIDFMEFSYHRRVLRYTGAAGELAGSDSSDCDIPF